MVLLLVTMFAEDYTGGTRKWSREIDLCTGAVNHFDLNYSILVFNQENGHSLCLEEKKLRMK